MLHISEELGTVNSQVKDIPRVEEYVKLSNSSTPLAFEDLICVFVHKEVKRMGICKKVLLIVTLTTPLRNYQGLRSYFQRFLQYCTPTLHLFEESETSEAIQD